jgi:hypothetical protein
MMGRSGPVFDDRFHSHVLRTPAEVRNALRYVVGNFASHAARRNELMRQGWVDPFSSASAKAPRGAQVSLFPESPVRPAKTWLLRQGERPLTQPLVCRGRGRGASPWSRVPEERRRANGCHLHGAGLG